MLCRVSLHESSGLSDSELIQRFSPEDPALGGRPTDDPALDGVRPTDDPTLGLGPLREMLEFGCCIFYLSSSTTLFLLVSAELVWMP